MGLIAKGVIGKRYEPTLYPVTDQAILAYARSYGDDRPAYHDAAPLMFAVVYSLEAGAKPLLDPATTADPMKLLRRLVRGSLDVEALAKVRTGDTLTTYATLVGVEEREAGELLQIDTLSHNQRGEEVARVKNFHFIRAESRGARAARPEREPINIDWETDFVVPAALPIEYAEASLDRNPIHTDDNFAKMAGFPGIILQGSATMAIAASAIVDAVCDGDPARLRQLRCRFAKPVFPGDRLTTRGGRLGQFETRNQDRVVVLDEGAFEAEGMNL